MNMKNTTIILFLLFLIPSVLGAGEYTSNCGDGSSYLCMVPANDQDFIFNQTQDFRMHTFNETGGVVQDSTLTCSGRIVDTSGNGFGVSKTNTFSSYSKFTISSGFLDDGDVVTYTLWCVDSSGREGFLSGELNLITGDEPISQNPAVMIAVVLIPLLIAFAFIVGAGQFGEDHGVLKMVGYLLILPFSWVSFMLGNVAIKYFYQFTEMTEIISSTVEWSVWLFFGIFAYIMLYAFYKAIHKSAQKKKERLEY